MSDSGAWRAELDGLFGRRLGPPTPSLKECCLSVSSFGDALPASLLGSGSANDEELVPLHDVHSFITAFCQSGSSLPLTLGCSRRTWTCWRYSRSCGRVLVLRWQLLSSLPCRLDFSETLVCVGGTLSEALRLGSVLRLLLPSGSVGAVRFQHRFPYSVLYLFRIRSCGSFGRRLNSSLKAATWLILPVVICLSQRLSHACLSINCFIL